MHAKNTQTTVVHQPAEVVSLSLKYGLSMKLIGHAVSKGVIEVTTTELLYQDRKTMQRWPFANIQCLECKGKNMFHFQLVDPNFPYPSEYTLHTFQCSRASELCELVHKAMESGSIIQDGGYDTAWNLNGM